MLERRRPLRMLLFWILALGWIYVLFYFSSQTGVESGSLSKRIADWLLRNLSLLEPYAKNLEFWIRKLAHFGIFAVEGALLALALMETFLGRRMLSFFVGGAFCAAAAVLNEYSQTFADGRSCEVRDMLIDTGGALCGILLVIAVWSLVLRHRRKAML